jgi:hypothetical protein
VDRVDITEVNYRPEIAPYHLGGWFVGFNSDELQRLCCCFDLNPGTVDDPRCLHSSSAAYSSHQCFEQQRFTAVSGVL